METDSVISVAAAAQFLFSDEEFNVQD